MIKKHLLKVQTLFFNNSYIKKEKKHFNFSPSVSSFFHKSFDSHNSIYYV